MPRIFISYRHGDRDKARSIYHALAQKCGEQNVFIDDQIETATEWKPKIRHEIELCDVILALIGQRWVFDEQGRNRLNNPNEYSVLRLN